MQYQVGDLVQIVENLLVGRSDDNVESLKERIGIVMDVRDEALMVQLDRGLVLVYEWQVRYAS